MPEVPKERTRLEPIQAGQAFTAAWRDRFGQEPPRPVLRLLIALSDLETGAWQSMWNFNFGNQIATRDSQAFYRALDSGNPRRFRAYGSAKEGAASFVRQLTSDTRPEWHAGLLTGDPDAFNRALAGMNGGYAYYEANPETYGRVLRERWEKYPPPPEPQPPPEPEPRKEPKRKTHPEAGPALAALIVVAGGLLLLTMVTKGRGSTV